MAEYMGCDRFRELWLEIDQYHLNYLEADESPRKLDEMRKLEGIALTIVFSRFNNRYSLTEIYVPDTVLFY